MNQEDSSHVMNSSEFSKTCPECGRCIDPIFAEQDVDAFTKKAWVRLHHALNQA
jgi:hypothetical protein